MKYAMYPSLTNLKRGFSSDKLIVAELCSLREIEKRSVRIDVLHRLGVTDIVHDVHVSQSIGKEISHGFVRFAYDLHTDGTT